MTRNKVYRSEISGAIHEMIQDAQDTDVVSRPTLRTFETLGRRANIRLAQPKSAVGQGFRETQAELISQLQGHATGSLTLDVYAQDPGREAKAKAIALLSYPGLVA